MATSGRMQGNSINIGGNGNNFYFIDWQLASQNQGGNYSTINWQAYMHYNSADAQLDNGIANLAGATRWSNGGRVYNFASNYTTRDMFIASGSFTIGHDQYGNATLYVDGGITAYSGNRTEGSAAWALPSLATVPSVVTYDPYNIGISSVVGYGADTCGGNYPISSRGFCLSTSPNPRSGTVSQAGNNVGAFALTITGLAPNTTYYICAYATNGIGTTFGADKVFTTLEAPVVTTDPVTNIAGTTVTANGAMSNNGNPDVTERGFVYGTADSPTTANNKVSVTGTGLGAYSANITGLTPSTLYYIRSYAINSTGTVYGAQRTFSTIVVPTVLTTAATDVTTTSATGHGEITSDGGGAITARGFVWAETSNPTLANGHVTEGGTTTGAFTDTLEPLTPSKTYYYRAYATNSAGTAYGSNQVLSTEATPPAQPSEMVPASGSATDDLTPTLSWKYNPGSANDLQYAYQVMVIRQSDSTTMFDSGKVVSADHTLDVPAESNLVYGIAYQWKVKTWNQDDMEGAYSTLALFTESERPVAEITYPTDASSITTNIPTIAWTYTDPESKVQSKFWLRIYDVNAALIYDSGLTIGADTSVEIADNILFNHEAYTVSLLLEDADGMQSILVENDFTVEFLAPALPTVSATQAVDGVVTVHVGLNKPPLDGWFTERLNIYKKLEGDLNWSAFRLNQSILENILDTCETVSGLTESGVGVAAELASGKYGTNSYGLGTSAEGDAIYTKTIAVTDLNLYDTFEAFVYISATDNISSIDFKIGNDSENYYLISTPVSGLAADVWNPIFAPSSLWVTVGSPSLTSLEVLSIEIKNATGAITVGDIKVDHIRLAKSNYQYTDYTTAATQVVLYAVNGQSIEASVSSNLAQTEKLTIAFTETRINTYLVPLDNTELTVKAFMDGTRPPSWSDHTETKYYQTKGSTKPTVLVNELQKYKEGSVELRFFDTRFNGQGILGVDSLEVIKNIKPLLLRTWWGKNYYISIDGSLSTTRRSGIGWFVEFDFTEINS